ncbi:hypothetical protein CALVIDRAFT_172054 [Calocera viscosa TUFC12733]|uniref:Uncharacterized protein n=1 Tax=Calocera viscosa (strain TUFC12733) TaxID=1330018 RepID=A0A167L9Z5_CALVF|nr:hypothetical protein CALVIDRAFT_172054 [Calocera viscosa TUFC12733]
MLDSACPSERTCVCVFIHSPLMGVVPLSGAGRSANSNTRVPVPVIVRRSSPASGLGNGRRATESGGSAVETPNVSLWPGCTRMLGRSCWRKVVDFQRRKGSLMSDFWALSPAAGKKGELNGAGPCGEVSTRLRLEPGPSRCCPIVELSPGPLKERTFKERIVYRKWTLACGTASKQFEF